MRRLAHIMAIIVVVGAMLCGDSATARAADSVDVEVRSIEARKDAPEDKPAVDPKLSELKSKLTGTFGDYKYFKQLSVSSFSLEKGTSHSVSLPNGDEADFEYKGKADDLLRIGVNVADRASISLRVSSGSTFFQAGLDVDGGMLIVAVTVTETSS